MKDLRIVFMGTPQFAVASLEALVENNYKVVGVITAPDRPAGRGQKLRQSAVKEFAVAKDIPVLQPTNLKDEIFLEQLALWQADLQIIVAFRMLPRVVWSMPQFGTFNLHASLLPEYRGAAPINWAIINGEKITGNTTFFIDDKIDTGAIILQQKVNITPQMSAGELHDTLMHNGASLVLQTVERIVAGSVVKQSQPNYEPKTAYKLTKENTKIDWNATGAVIHNFIRGLSPYPSAWCFLENKGKEQKVKISAARFIEEKQSLTQGSIKVVDKSLMVAVQDGWIQILKLQLPGKKAMETKALLNGFKFDERAKMC